MDNKKIKQMVDAGQTVTVTMPLGLALKVLDNELGDDHYQAQCDAEYILFAVLEELDIDEDAAQDFHASCGLYGGQS